MSLNVSQSFSDISLSFSKNPVTKDIFILKNENAIKKSVINLFKTKIGERFFNDLLGSSIENTLFELDSTELNSILTEEAQNLCENFEPRVKIKNVFSEIPLDSNDLNITIQYDIVGIPIPTQTVDFILQPTRV